MQAAVLQAFREPGTEDKGSVTPFQGVQRQVFKEVAPLHSLNMPLQDLRPCTSTHGADPKSFFERLEKKKPSVHARSLPN